MNSIQQIYSKGNCVCKVICNATPDHIQECEFLIRDLNCSADIDLLISLKLDSEVRARVKGIIKRISYRNAQ